MLSREGAGYFSDSVRMGAALGLVMSTAACTVTTENYQVDEKYQSTHAIARVSRTQEADGTTRGTALAAFVQMPDAEDPSVTFRLAGLDTDRPEPGRCLHRDDENDDLAAVTSAELLEADGVQLVTSEGVHVLAPHAFPGVYDLLRGVIYASRDQSGDDLPALGDYRLQGAPISESGETNTSSVSSIEHQSPAFPENILINGTDWTTGEQLAPAKFADLSWTPSAYDADLILVTVSSGTSSYACTFVDADGYGSVPLSAKDGSPLVSEGGEALIEVHRLRSAFGGADDKYRVQLNFDFSTEKVWQFSEPTQN